MISFLAKQRSKLILDTARNPHEVLSQTTHIFNELVDFLRDKKSFNNPEINAMVTLLWRVVGNKVIPTVFDVSGQQIPTLGVGLLADEKESEAVPIVGIPINFVNQVRSDPFMQLGAMTTTSSRAQDIYAKKTRFPDEEVATIRALAHESTMLQSAMVIAKTEGELLPLNAYQLDVVAQYPNGIEDIPEDMRYPTPEYVFKRIVIRL